MTTEEPGRDPELAEWLARSEAPDPAAIERLARRVSHAVHQAWPGQPRRTWRTETARWSRLLVPLAAAAGIAAAVVVGSIGVPVATVTASVQDSTQLLDVLRRTDAENYLVTVAVTNYRDDWVTGLVGSTQ